jgi:DNA segregation ATPase FtsK/SpoIIIE, S-DNA-T family
MSCVRRRSLKGWLWSGGLGFRRFVVEKSKEKLIVDTFAKLGIKVEVLGITCGVTYSLFELGYNELTTLAKILASQDDLAITLSVEDVRIAPVPVKNAVGLEVPNRERAWVDFDSFTDALEASKKLRIPVALGKDVSGKPIIIDLASCAHLLVAGNPGTGKTMFYNSLICSILRTKSAEEVSFAIVDTKGVEFPVYNGNPGSPRDSHLLLPVITKVSDAFDFLDNLLIEIDMRIKLFNEAGVRNIEDYNCLASEGLSAGQDLGQRKLPYIVVLVDEFSRLMMEDGKRFETLIKQITDTAKFCGIHLVISTNRCSADIITGVIKNSFPSLIAFAVSSSLNSMIILDQPGAEKLLGSGDMLFCLRRRGLNRVQGAMVDVAKELQGK